MCIMDLEKVSIVNTWCTNVYKELSTNKENCLPYRKWLKLITKYYVDFLNTHFRNISQLNQMHDELVWQTADKLEVTQHQVIDIFERARDCETELLSIYDITSKIPTYLQEKLTKQTNRDEFIQLSIRYHVLGYSEGLFLSIDRHIYQKLMKSSKLPVLECYASPFNHNIDTYCSLFEEDKVFGALPRFDVFIDSINFPCRLIVNPPYTTRVIETCINKIINYMNRCNGEFIAMLPIMYHYPPLEKLLSYGNTKHVLLKKGTYCVFNFVSQVNIIFPSTVYIVANVGGCPIKSQLMADNISNEMRRTKSLMAPESSNE